MSEVNYTVTVDAPDPQAIVDAMRRHMRLNTAFGSLRHALNKRDRFLRCGERARERRQWHKAVYP